MVQVVHLLLLLLLEGAEEEVMLVLQQLVDPVEEDTLIQVAKLVQLETLQVQFHHKEIMVVLVQVVVQITELVVVAELVVLELMVVVLQQELVVMVLQMIFTVHQEFILQVVVHTHTEVHLVLEDQVIKEVQLLL